jgi:hypothetical protein
MTTSAVTYECYVCKRNNFIGVRVLLDGRTEDGKTIYKNPDMTPHVHKQHTQETRQIISGSTTVVSESTMLKVISAKLDRVITLLEELHGKKL